MVERRVDVLTVRWYELRGRSPGAVARWLEAARAHLPEAVPRRFGDTEPLRGRLEREGGEGLLRAYAAADPLLFLAGAPPVHHASLGAGSRGRVVAHSLLAELDAGDEAVRRFALALTHPGTVYVSASVAGDMVLEDGTLYGPAGRREEPYLAPRGDWLGLPPEPPVWCWFGPAYARLVRRDVAGRETGGGLLWTGGPWVRESLRARLSEPDPARKPATRLPRGLRRSVWRLLGG